MARPTEIPVDELRGTLADVCRRASYGGERFLITFHGKPRFAMVSVADLEQLEGKPVVAKGKRRSK